MPASNRPPAPNRPSPSATGKQLPEVVPVVTPRQPPAGRKFPCPACGARLDFDPSIRGLKCPYCGHNETIEATAATVQERNWDEYWSKHSTDDTVIPGRSTQVTCTGCGAVVLLQDQVVTDKCPYCATHLENKPESAEGQIEPGGLLPFCVTERDGIKAFNGWIASRWFAPTSLKLFATLGKLAGVYVPNWTFDSMTYTHYTGERGDDYTQTETYTERDSEGNNVTKTRSVTKTRWSYVSGTVDHFFDDVLVYAAKSLPENLVIGLEPWDLPQLEDFKAQFLSGFQTERYTVNLTDGFATARAVMDGEIRTLCCRDIGGDHQRLSSVQTQHVGVTFKHILLPVWLAAYRYYDKPYRVIVNGRTGKVTGTRPYSWIKITLFVLFIIAMIAGVIALWAAAQGGGRYGQMDAPAVAAMTVPCTGERNDCQAPSPLAGAPVATGWGERSACIISRCAPTGQRTLADPSPPTPLPQGERGGWHAIPSSDGLQRPQPFVASVLPALPPYFTPTPS